MNPPLILVVEDETDIRHLITLTLEFNGFAVEQATNGIEAVQKATVLKPDLVLMDIRMPKMNGYEACRVLKNQINTQAIPIVFLSAKDQEANIKTGLALGAAAYFIKPFDPETLPHLIKQILAEY